MKSLKSFTNFLDAHLGYLLVIPAILLILAFSVIPIALSLQYSFFDYQLNDQRKNDIFFSEHYNIELANEDVEYIEFYLNTEKDVAKKQSTIDKIQSVIDRMKASYEDILKRAGARSGVVKINKDLYRDILKFNEEVQKGVDEVYAIEGEEFLLKEDTKAVAKDFDKTIIKSNFIGFANFIRAFKDEKIYQTLLITLIFTITSVFLELVLGLVLALVMNKPLKGKGIIRTTSLIPWAIPTSVAALMWLYMYNGDAGVIAIILAKLHIIESPAVLLGQGNIALVAVILADAWKTTPYMALMLLAGLQTIPNTLYESSAIDGANKFQQFWKITLPLLKSSILVALLFRTLDAFRVFDLIWILTYGGPGGKTESISIYSYKLLKSQSILGYGSAVVIIMAIIVGIISFIYIKVLGAKITREV